MPYASLTFSTSRPMLFINDIYVVFYVNVMSIFI